MAGALRLELRFSVLETVVLTFILHPIIQMVGFVVSGTDRDQICPLYAPRPATRDGLIALGRLHLRAFTTGTRIHGVCAPDTSPDPHRSQSTWWDERDSNPHLADFESAACCRWATVPYAGALESGSTGRAPADIPIILGWISFVHLNQGLISSRLLITASTTWCDT